LNKNSREVSAIAINPEGDKIATADKSNDHIVSVFDIGSGKCLYSEKGGPDQIHGLAFHQGGASELWSAGVKHFNYYKWNESKKHKGLFGSYPRTSFACVCADASGNAYSGGTNSIVYKWNGNKCEATYSKHAKGFVGAVHWSEGKLYSGGKDGGVICVDDKSLEVLA
jgi:WD40 repeat protein